MVVFVQIVVFNAQLNVVFSKMNCLFAPPVHVMQLV